MLVCSCRGCAGLVQTSVDVPIPQFPLAPEQAPVTDSLVSLWASAPAGPIQWSADASTPAPQPSIIKPAEQTPWKTCDFNWRVPTFYGSCGASSNNSDITCVCGCSRVISPIVKLNIYKRGPEGMSRSQRVFCEWFVTHTGVQRDTKNGLVEYAFNGGGIKTIVPRSEPDWVFQRAITMGNSSDPRAGIGPRGAEMRIKYREGAYRSFHRNCNHFSKDSLMSLVGVGCPPWVNRPARLVSRLLLLDLFCPIPVRIPTFDKQPEAPASCATSVESPATPLPCPVSTPGPTPATAAPAEAPPAAPAQPEVLAAPLKSGRKWHRPPWVKVIVTAVKKVCRRS